MDFHNTPLALSSGPKDRVSKGEANAQDVGAGAVSSFDTPSLALGLLRVRKYCPHGEKRREASRLEPRDADIHFANVRSSP